MVDSNFPGITLRDIDVEGVDTVKGGTPFWFFRTAGSMTDLSQGEILEKIVGDKQTVMYEMDVRVSGPAIMQKARAEQKARAWVRMNNPFTPSIIKVLRSRKKSGNWKKGLSKEDMMASEDQDVYTVRLVIDR